MLGWTWWPLTLLAPSVWRERGFFFFLGWCLTRLQGEGRRSKSMKTAWRNQWLTTGPEPFDMVSVTETGHTVYLLLVKSSGKFVTWLNLNSFLFKCYSYRFKSMDNFLSFWVLYRSSIHLVLALLIPLSGIQDTMSFSVVVLFCWDQNLAMWGPQTAYGVIFNHASIMLVAWLYGKAVSVSLFIHLFTTLVKTWNISTIISLIVQQLTELPAWL